MPMLKRTGLDIEDVRSLFTLSPLFILPTLVDHYSLIALEAAMSGCQLCLNDDRPFLHEMFATDRNIIWHSFGNLQRMGQLDAHSLTELAKRLWDRVLMAPHSKTGLRGYHSECDFARDLEALLTHRDDTV
jgi:hypothetical protein